MDIVDVVFPYLMSGIGFLVVYVLMGIKNELSDLKLSLRDLEKEVWPRITQLEVAVSKIQTMCHVMHSNAKETL